MKTSYEVRAEKFLHQFYDYIAHCDSWHQFEKAVRHFNYDHRRHVVFAHGLTRVCFITSDYVIKYDFGSYRNVHDFGSCADEVRLYALAEKEGFAHLLAKPTMVEYMGHTFCIMPRIPGIGKYQYDVYEYLAGDECDWVMEHIYDAHNQNYGWKEGHPVIIDYACNAHS